MTIIDYLKQQFIEEGALTRKFLALVNENDWHFKPHEKSMPVNALATHLADLPGWFHLILTTDELDFAIHPEPSPLKDTAELLACFDKRYEEGLSVLVPGDETVLKVPWTLRHADKIFLRESKANVLCMSMSQQIHHRAQLGVYLRLLNIPIPGSYGPSADDNSFM